VKHQILKVACLKGVKAAAVVAPCRWVVVLGILVGATFRHGQSTLLCSFTSSYAARDGGCVWRIF
ncbi:UNVERIFIED_CONTAM: hypothetical protein KWE97_19815, partial [Acinetobacter pittii]